MICGGGIMMVTASRQGLGIRTMVAAGAKSVVSKEMAGLFLYRQIKAGVENLPLLSNAA
jgi:hypothetical protein